MPDPPRRSWRKGRRKSIAKNNDCLLTYAYNAYLRRVGIRVPVDPRGWLRFRRQHMLSLVLGTVGRWVSSLAADRKATSQQGCQCTYGSSVIIRSGAPLDHPQVYIYTSRPKRSARSHVAQEKTTVKYWRRRLEHATLPEASYLISRTHWR